jgi:A/G-specific adenine glycosylase
MFTPFKKKLIEWYTPESRPLPWKASDNPYHIWLSEIILQQTRAEQGLPYYLKFITLYPTVADLAQSEEQDVLKTWEGLGYYSRARNLLKAARQVVDIHGGQFPANYSELLQLKGVGPYTAAAIASFAFHLPHAVLDGNVFRVLSRSFGIDTPVDSPSGKKVFADLAQNCLDAENPATYNQAIMDFGSTACTPAKPLCGNCPLSSECVAFREGRQQLLPVKSKKLIRQNRFFHYFVIRDAQSVLIEKRSESDIWKGLYQFPCIESNSVQHSWSLSDIGLEETVLKSKHLSPEYRQILTHRNIIAHFADVEVEDVGALMKASRNSYESIPLSSIHKYAFPKIIRQYLSDRDNSLH